MSWLQNLPPIIRMTIERLLSAQPVANMLWIQQKADQLVSAIGPLFLDDVHRVSQNAPSGQAVSIREIFAILAVAAEKLANDIQVQARQPPTELNILILQQLQKKYSRVMDMMNQILEQQNQELMSAVRARG